MLNKLFPAASDIRTGAINTYATVKSHTYQQSELSTEYGRMLPTATELQQTLIDQEQQENVEINHLHKDLKIVAEETVTAHLLELFDNHAVSVQACHIKAAASSSNFAVT